MMFDHRGGHSALVADLTRSVFPRGIAVAARDPRLLPEVTDASEESAVSGAVPRRRAEFHAGRTAARAAMIELDVPPRPVPSGADRAPLWPNGVVGSISHCRSACVAVLGHGRDWAAIGVDLEESAKLSEDLVEVVCGKTEIAWLDTLDPQGRGIMAKLIFCAKEATYKAQYSVTGAIFGFDHLEITIDRLEARFDARFLQPAGRFAEGTVLPGRYAHAAGVLVTGMALPHPETASGRP